VTQVLWVADPRGKCDLYEVEVKLIFYEVKDLGRTCNLLKMSQFFAL
jgi:hypothetical protein